MMNHNICLRCYLATGGKSLGVKPPKEVLAFEKLWKERQLCLCFTSIGLPSVKSRPPKNCPYILEQMVSQC
jgi:hypothetical protein